MHLFLGTRSGEFVFGSSGGTALSGFTSIIVSGICTWDGEAVEMAGVRPRHSLPSSLKNDPDARACAVTGLDAKKPEGHAVV